MILQRFHEPKHWHYRQAMLSPGIWFTHGTMKTQLKSKDAIGTSFCELGWLTKHYTVKEWMWSDWTRWPYSHYTYILRGRSVNVVTASICPVILTLHPQWKRPSLIPRKCPSLIPVFTSALHPRLSPWLSELLLFVSCLLILCRRIIQNHWDIGIRQSHQVTFNGERNSSVLKSLKIHRCMPGKLD